VTSATRELLGNRYRLVERLATGGMGVVWRAVDERLDRPVAVKLIRPEYADDPTFRQRLRLEARAIAAIRSPHVVRIHDVCEEEDPAGGWRSYLVMELVDGEPLSERLRHGPLPLATTRSVIAQAATALAAAHQRHIVHRDVKPGNVMVDHTGQVTVLDFGIARAADAVSLTATDLVLGTARYLSPEQADGKAATGASDVYSLGVLAYHCLTGNVPFDATSDIAVVLAHRNDPVPPLPASVPPDVAGLVNRMLAKAPEERPTAAQTATEIADPGDAGQPDVPVIVPPPTDPDTGPLAFASTHTLPRVRQPAASNPTAVLPAAMVARHAFRDRLHARADGLRDSRSASVRAAPLALPAVAALLVIMAAVAIASSPSSAGQPAAAGSHSTAAVHAPPKVRIDPTAYIGQQWSLVRGELVALGVRPVPTFVADGPDGTVIGLAPTGRVAKGTAISVVVSQAGPAHPPPAHGPKPKPPGHDPGHGDHGDGG
jgi:serine/threonine-protein kinase